MNQLAEAVQTLTDQVEALAGHVEILSQAIEEFRQDFQWAVLNDKLHCPQPVTQDFPAELAEEKPKRRERRTLWEK